MTRAVKSETRSFYAQAVQRVIERVAGDLDAALDLETLAASACLSPFHFHRVFRGMVGETPLELVRRLRMERAAWRLVHTDRNVVEIAFDAGYETHEAFTRAFRSAYGASPSDFRRRPHPRTNLAASCGIHFDPTGGMTLFTPFESGGLSMQVDIRDMPAKRVGAVRHIGPYTQIGSAFTALGDIAGPAGLFNQPGVEMVALYYDDPEATPADKLRSDAGIVVPESAELPAGLTEQRLPAGTYAKTLYVGPYEGLPDAWAKFLGEWFPANDKRVADGVSYELYLNDPTTTRKEKLETEIYVPVA